MAVKKSRISSRTSSNKSGKKQHTASSISIIIPTYNESKNISLLIPMLEKLFFTRTYEILVVDDSSPDGTGDVVKRLAKKNPRIRLITRTKKEGIGAALRQGYNSAKNQLILSTDADLSFAPKDLLKFVDKLENGYDLVTANRHSSGAKYEKPTLRVWIKGIISKLGNKTVTIGLPVHDLSANFRGIKRTTWRSINTKEKTNAILAEMIIKAHRKGYKVTDVITNFKDRRFGTSKINYFKEAPKFLIKVIKYRIF